MSLLKSLATSTITLLFISFSFNSLLFISGCSDDIIQNSHYIEGTVIGNQETRPRDVKLSVNYGSAINAQVNGSFTFSNIETPYDLLVFDNSGGFFHQYKGITAHKPRIKLPFVYGTSILKHAAIKLKFPTLPAGDKMYFSFQSIYNVNLQPFSVYDSSAILNMDWQDFPEVSGNLILLQVKKSGDDVVSYDRFGKRQITISDGGEYDSSFSAQDLSYNPAESVINIDPPQGAVQNMMDINILFKGFPLQSAVKIVSNNNSPNYSIVVPAALPVEFKLGYELITFDISSGNRITAYGNMSPGEYRTIEMPAPVILMYPSADTVGVDNNTEFQHNGSGNVYEFKIGNYSVFTKLNTAKIPLMEIYGFPLPVNTQFNWSVVKYNTSSMEDLVKAYDWRYPSYHMVTINSEEREFRTRTGN